MGLCLHFIVASIYMAIGTFTEVNKAFSWALSNRVHSCYSTQVYCNPSPFFKKIKSMLNFAGLT